MNGILVIERLFKTKTKQYQTRDFALPRVRGQSKNASFWP